MMQQLCAFTERANASAARVVDTASALCGNLSKRFMAIGATTFAWNAMPPVHAHAMCTRTMCTHAKRYERRPQEMLT
jgi:hypothetical protein